MRTFVITVNGNSYEVNVDEIQEGQAVAAPVKKKEAPAPVSGGAGTKVSAPMPGTIMNVKVSVGDKVEKDDVLLTMEAMKMENAISAPCGGTVTAVAVGNGASVNTGDLLVSIG